MTVKKISTTAEYCDALEDNFENHAEAIVGGRKALAIIVSIYLGITIGRTEREIDDWLKKKKEEEANDLPA